VERTMPDAEEPGDLAKTCRRHVCGLLYVCRGTRPDVSLSVCCLSRRLHKWRRIDDKRLNQVMSYLATYPDLGVCYVHMAKDEGELFCELWSDTDHGGDLPTAKSTSGAALLCVGHHGSKALVEWSSKLQDYVALSSGEAELVGVVHGLRRVGLPGQLILEELMSDRQDGLHLTVCIDNSAAETVARTGQTKEMKYLRKTQRISESWAQEQLFASGRKDRSTKLVGTKENRADLFTKSLDRDTHWKFVELLGMMSKSAFLKTVKRA
jgi:hypothetical protein